MLDERVVTCIFGYNVKVRRRVAHYQHAGVEGNVKVERIRAVAGKSDPGSAQSQALYRRREFERHGFPTRADEDDHTHLLVVE